MSPKRFATTQFNCTVLAGVVLLLSAVPCLAQDKGKRIQDKPAPTHKNIAYGTHKRNVLDFWQAKSDKPTPLAIYIHGGGFIGGSKDEFSPAVLKGLLDAGISVASIEYRLIADAPLPAAHQDVTRALQFLRYKAKDWNIDKSKVGGFGGSAGAQLCMYLAFHDDLADLKSDDPIARESSRLACVAPDNGQMTMDQKLWEKYVPGYVEKTMRRRTNTELFGTEDEAKATKIAAGLAALSLISKDDPPVFLTYRMAPGEAKPADQREVLRWLVHHVAHGVELKKLCDKLGVECHLQYPGAKVEFPNATAFLKAKLLGSGDKK